MRSHRERTGRVVKVQPKRSKAGGARPVGSAPRAAPELRSRTAPGPLLLRFGRYRAPLPSRTASAGRSPKPGPAGPGTAPSPRLFSFGSSGGTRREATRCAGTSRRPRAPAGSAPAGCGAVRGGARPRLPQPYLAQARRGAPAGPAHLACPRSDSSGRAGGLVVLMFLQLLLSTPFPIIPF